MKPVQKTCTAPTLPPWSKKRRPLLYFPGCCFSIFESGCVLGTAIMRTAKTLTYSRALSLLCNWIWMAKVYVIFVNTRCERKLKLRENWLIIENDFCLRLVHAKLVINFCWKEREKLSVFECACVSGESEIKNVHLKSRVWFQSESSWVDNHIKLPLIHITLRVIDLMWLTWNYHIS